MKQSRAWQETSHAQKHENIIMKAQMAKNSEDIAFADLSYLGEIRTVMGKETRTHFTNSQKLSVITNAS